MKSILIALLGALVLVCAASAQTGEPAGDLVMLRLADGSFLWGRIASHDAERVSFERLDNGGTVRVPWTRLDPVQSGELQERFGYVDHSGDELMVEADRLTLADGSEVIGKIINRTESELYVKTSHSLVPVPIARLRGAATIVQVPALDVYSREELYRSELDKLDKASASSEFELARFCERINDFAHALEHFQAAQALDASFQPSDVKQAIARSTLKASSQAQLDELYKIDSLRARGKFDAALAACDQFEQKYADSPLRADSAKKRQQIKKGRDAALRELVARSFYRWADVLIAKVARNPQMTLEASLAYLEDKLTDEIVTAMHKELQHAIGESLTPEEVRKVWQSRKTIRFRRASYGQGTWLLGEKQARAGLEEEKKEEGPKSEKDAERSKLEEKLKRYLQNQQVLQKKKADSKEQGPSEQEVFWSTWTSTSRSYWLLAYYAEHGGELKLRNVDFSNCPDCNGTGVREIINTGSARSNPNQGGGGRSGGNSTGNSPNSANNDMIDCPLCHSIGVLRRVNYW
jgi:hypothetical protein